MTGKKRGSLLPLAVGLGLLLASCVSGCSPQSGNASEKVYVVGTDAAYPPFESAEGDGFAGFDIDVMNEVAKAAGFQLEWKNTGWPSLITDLYEGKVDIGMSAISITDKRREAFDFSDPYFEANQLILVTEDSPISKLADLQGKQIGVQAMTTGEDIAKKAFGDSYAGIRSYKEMPSAVNDFLSGRLDAVIGDNGVIIYYATKIKDKKFKLIKDEAFPKERYGIMVKKGNLELVQKINQGLHTIRTNGTLQKLYDRYFQQQ
ncbi:basic amino acid ABC transporter substrate-binding protein [Brevibacillus fluminis]|uniref:basic amino acid ABC transporter substrate-binding protein n=1 Tax=Brevibacillus fluminis TaxID=511487 RepID=UPI003F8A0316